MNPTPTPKPYLIGSIFVLLGAVFVSTKAIFVKLAYQYSIDSVSLLTLRMAFSVPFFVLIAIWSLRKKKNRASPLTRKEWFLIILMGLFGYYFASLFDFIGLKYISASFERIILYLYPTLVLLISLIFLKKKIHNIQLIAVGLTYFGVGLAFWENLQNHIGDHVWLGTGLVFLSALFYSIYLIVGGMILPKVGTSRFNSIAMLAAAIGIFTHHFLFNQVDLLSFQLPVYYLSFAIAILATVIPTFLIVEGVKVIGANNAAIITSIGPISTIILAYIFLEERLGWLQWIGTLFVIAGVLLIALNKKPAH
jgi:drug/metabolite transporter (DMT)-like permease